MYLCNKVKLNVIFQVLVIVGVPGSHVYFGVHNLLGRLSVKDLLGQYLNLCRKRSKVEEKSVRQSAQDNFGSFSSNRDGSVLGQSSVCQRRL